MKRNLFAELTEGFDALAKQRQGKMTLRTTEIASKPTPVVSAAELKAIRESLSTPSDSGTARGRPVLEMGIRH